ncbi:beta-ketoacyl-[acyl-carrier-protein] synthase family protein, partial [Mitsuaria sp. TWR114]
RAALADAGIEPAQVGYVNAHGTATDVGDAVEAESLARVFGPRGVPVSATKALHGHLIGAGGALELIACVQALRRGELPRSANVRTSALEEIADVIREPRAFDPSKSMVSNSFAFGGSNVSLVVQSPD